MIVAAQHGGAGSGATAAANWMRGHFSVLTIMPVTALEHIADPCTHQALVEKSMSPPLRE